MNLKTYILEKYKFLKLTQEGTEKMNKQIIIGKVELVIKSPSNQKPLELEYFIGEFTQTSKEQRNNNSFIIKQTLQT